MPQNEPQPTLGQVFKNVNFLKFWVGQLISYLGDRIDQMAMIAVVSAGATAAVGADRTNMITFWATLPYVLLSPFAGALIDRFDRRTLMIFMDIFRAVVVLAVPFAVSPQTHPGVVYAIVALIGCATCVFAPSKSAFIPEIVPREHLLRANSITSTMGTLTVLIGTVLGGKLVAVLSEPNNPVVLIVHHFYALSKLPVGLAVTLTIDALSYVFSALMLFWIRMPKVEEVMLHARQQELAREGGFFANVIDGMKFVTRERVPSMCVLLDSWFFLVGGILFTLITKIIFLKVGDLSGNETKGVEYYGFACGSLGLGLAIGGILTGRYGSRISLRILLPACYFGAGLFILALTAPLSLSHTFWLLGLIGYAAGGVVVIIETALQRGVPDEMRGRVFALNNLLLNSTLLVAILAGTLMLKSGINIHHMLIGTAIIAMAGALMALAAFPGAVTLAGMKPLPAHQPQAENKA